MRGTYIYYIHNNVHYDDDGDLTEYFYQNDTSVVQSWLPFQKVMAQIRFYTGNNIGDPISRLS